MEHVAESESQTSNSQLLLLNFMLMLFPVSTLLSFMPVETLYSYHCAVAVSQSSNYADNVSCLRAKNASNHNTVTLEMGFKYPSIWQIYTA